MKPQLSLGPVLFYWEADKWRDFYFRMADEAPVDIVYVGEVVCSKRAPFYEPLYDEVSERLKRAGKKVVLSTLAEIAVAQDRKAVDRLCERKNDMIEANDAAALWRLSGRPHHIGPFVNAYNEGTLAFLAKNGAVHACLPPELSSVSLAMLTEEAKKLPVTLEAQVYGRIPLALSARCYHARAHGRIKDNCRYACGEDPDGMTLKTMQDRPFLAINGIQTLSHACLNLAQEIHALAAMGVACFRLSPHTCDMAKVAGIFRDLADGAASLAQACESLKKCGPDLPFANGFYHRKEGHRWLAWA